MQNSSRIALLGFSILFSGILNYVYQYIMIQNLTISEYSDFISLVSIINLIGVLTVASSLFLVKEMSKDGLHIHSIISVSQRVLYFIGFFTFLLFLFFAPFLKSYLSIDSIFLVLLAGSSFIFFFISVYQWAFFQATKKTLIYSILQVLSPLIRIISGVSLVYIGFGASGAIGGFIVSQLLLFILGYILVRKSCLSLPLLGVTQKTIISSFLSQKKQIGQYFLISILIALLMNIDILIIKNIFDPETAGYYAAISVLAKFLVFLGLSIETVYYPQLVKESVLPKMQLLKLSVYYIAITLGALVFFILFGEMILRFFKEGLEEYIGIIYPLLIYCGILAYLSIIVKTLIAFERYTINYLLSILIGIMIVCIYQFGSTPLLITQIFALFGGLGLLLGFLQVARS